jgi:TetR/AcrR family transcriptional regulator, mexJK operon transcriptional repressor
MPKAEKSPPLGRPKDLDKRSAILRAARQLFFERGLDATTMEAAAAASGVAKMTVYANFPNKRRLFEAVIQQESTELGESLSGLQAVGPGIRAQLIAFGCDFIAFQFRPDVRAFNRIMAIEGSRHPELAKAFVASGPKAIFRLLIARLKESTARGEVQIKDFREAAGYITALWKGIETASMELGLSPGPTPDQIRNHVHHCVDFFLRAVSNRSSNSGIPPDA